MSDLASDAFSDIGHDGRRGPGSRLVEAREARRWTQEYVANQLHLPLHVIAGLEQDDYARLPPPTFVRGYLRNYARLLGLPEQEVIEKYLATREAGEDPGFPHAKAPAQVSSSDRRVRWVTYLIALSLVVLPLIWWRTQWAPGPSQGEEDGVSMPTGGGIETPSAPPNATASTPALDGSVPGSGAAAGGSGHLVSGPQDMPAYTSQPGAQGGGYEIPGGSPGSEEGSEADDMVLAPAAPTATATGEGGAQPPPPPQGDTLVLRFERDAWAQVVDAEGKRLLYGTTSKGSTKTFQGKPPFQLVIGNPRAVKVEYDGQVIDPRTKENQKGIARFEVGAAPEMEPAAGQPAPSAAPAADTAIE